MYAETAGRVLSQIVLLSGLLAGFSFSGIALLAPLREKSRLVSATLLVFLCAAALLLYAAITGALTLAYPLETLTGAEFARMAHLYTLIQWPFRLGLGAFLAGLGLVGWIRSRQIGMVSTVLAAVVLVGWVAWGLFLRSLFGR